MTRTAGWSQDGRPTVTHSRTWAHVIGAAVLALALTACGTDAEPTAGQQPDDETGSSQTETETEAAPEAERVVFGVGGVGSLAYLGYYIAEEIGLLQDCADEVGVEIETVGFKGSADAIKALAAGELDFVTAGVGQAISLLAGGQDALVVTALNNAGGIVAIASNDLPADFTLADAGGHTWGVGGIGTLGHEQAIAMARAYGADPAAITFLPIGGVAGYVASLEKGEVDIAAVGQPFAAQIEAEGLGRALASMYDPEVIEQTYPGGYISNVVIARKEFIDANPRISQAIVAAHVQALQWLHEHSAEEAFEALGELVAEHEAYWDVAFEDMMGGVPEEGIIDETRVENVMAAEKESGRVPADTTVQVSDVYDNSLVEAALSDPIC